AIPVYAGEKNYPKVAKLVRGYLSTIIKLVVSPRNLASGILLARLVDTIVSSRPRVHYVCGFHQHLNVYLTWPYQVGRSGVEQPISVDLGSNAANDLDSLIAIRKSKSVE
ncbi:unnamed protein product, partial [marine sediment metagenome]